ncbi:Mariner Mos1 transposase [Eumeta japonica]|uniref:Mariner Mos1 transposase n=1 Tax=Eumeta variegata TaxID=151549 RepID=A0A4C1TTT8_EUMVA|nr:Mariner Mos1 transposase [Eumeta japonica]
MPKSYLDHDTGGAPARSATKMASHRIASRHETTPQSTGRGSSAAAHQILSRPTTKIQESYPFNSFFELMPEAHRLLIEAYNEVALIERTYREWFQKFKNGDFDVEGKDHSGRPKIYEDVELKELLEEDSSHTQKELALTLEVTQQAVSHRLKSLGMIHKQGNWFPYESKPRDVESRLLMNESLIAKTQKKRFLHLKVKR